MFMPPVPNKPATHCWMCLKRLYKDAHTVALAVRKHGMLIVMQWEQLILFVTDTYHDACAAHLAGMHSMLLKQQQRTL